VLATPCVLAPLGLTLVLGLQWGAKGVARGSKGCEHGDLALFGGVGLASLATKEMPFGS